MPASIRMRRAVVLPFAVLGMLFATFVTTAPEAQALTRTQMVSNSLAIAKHQIGDPYRYGAAGPGAFDCSGLLYYSARRAGFSQFPRTSDAQYRFVRHIRKSNLRPGDFVFFHNSGDVYHAAIFVGRNKSGVPIILHAPRTGERVKYASPWTTSWFAGTLRPA
jgi:cell wall-associated NlpC family hydrolase